MQTSLTLWSSGTQMRTEGTRIVKGTSSTTGRHNSLVPDWNRDIRPYELISVDQLYTHVIFRLNWSGDNCCLRFRRSHRLVSGPDVGRKHPAQRRIALVIIRFLPCCCVLPKASPARIGLVNPLCVSYFVWNHWRKSSSGAPYWLPTALSVWAGEWRGRTAARHLTEKEPSSPGREAAFKLSMWVVLVGVWN